MEQKVATRMLAPTGPILVTGATGNVGAEVMRLLVKQGHAVRAAVRDVAAQHPQPFVTFVPFDFAEPDTFMPSLAGVRKVFLMRPPALADTKRYINPFIDVAAVAVRVLTENGHQNKAYPLTGSEALSYGEVAQIFGEELGCPIKYPRPGALAFALRMWARGMAWAFIGVMIGIYTTARLHLAGTVTPDMARLLERDPITVRQFVRDYRDIWM